MWIFAYGHEVPIRYMYMKKIIICINFWSIHVLITKQKENSILFLRESFKGVL